MDMKGVQIHLTMPTLQVDLSLPNKGVSAIMGASGAGKTTLLRAVAGLESLARGSIQINGEVWQSDEHRIFLPAHRRPLGFVFQDSHLFAHLSVQKNIEFGWRRIPSQARKIALEQAVQLLGIEGLLSRFPATLSGGEKQRVAIARALATSPHLLLMDEPLAALDEQRKADVLPYLERLHQELQIPVLYVSHATDEVMRLADYVVLLEQGRVCAKGSVAEMFPCAKEGVAKGQDGSICGAMVSLPYLYTGTRLDPSIARSGPFVTPSEDEQMTVELDINGQRVAAHIDRAAAQQMQLWDGVRLAAKISSSTRADSQTTVLCPSTDL